LWDERESKGFSARIGGKMALSRFGYGFLVTRNSSVVPTAPFEIRRTPPPLKENRKKMEFFNRCDFGYQKILGFQTGRFLDSGVFSAGASGRQRVAGDSPIVEKKGQIVYTTRTFSGGNK
jgi:hypothetical protein